MSRTTAQSVFAALMMATLLVVTAACGSDDMQGNPVLGECPTASQSQVATGAMVLTFTCEGCHNSRLVGPDRKNAPAGMDFDDPTVRKTLAVPIYETAVGGSMPPPNSDAPKLSEAQVEALRVFLACEAVEE